MYRFYEMYILLQHFFNKSQHELLKLKLSKHVKLLHANPWGRL